MPKTVMSIPSLERWWLADQRDLHWITNPDVDDNHVRYETEPDWNLVASVVQGLGRQLVTGSLKLDPDDPEKHLLEWERLPELEERIVRAWFHTGAQSPTADPWSTSLVDGRHRLWATWRAQPNARLPILSYTLGFLEAADDGEVSLSAIQAEIRQGLGATSAVVMSRNPQLVAELERVLALP